MVDLNKCLFFFKKGGVLILSGKVERSGFYRIETPVQIQSTDMIRSFPIFSATKSPGTQCPKLTTIVNSKQIHNSG